MSNFFWWCAGVNKKLLHGCKNEYSKYFAIGATIFFTAVFATFSGGYALYYVFAGSEYAVYLAVLIGLLWGGMIFNIDRFLVISLKKEGKPLKEFGMALPRIILAIMIGIVIARPLELKLFEKEIHDGLKNQYKQNYYNNERTRIVNEKQNLQIALEDLNIQYDLKRNDLNIAKADRDSARIWRDRERFGDKTGRTSGKSGWGPETDKLQKEVEQKENLYDTLSIQVATLEKTLLSKQQELIPQKNLTEEELNNNANQWAMTAGFYDRNKMLSKISSGEYLNFENAQIAFNNEVNENTNANVNQPQIPNNIDMPQKEKDGDLTVIFIALLFIIVECLPIVVKLMSKRGNYDSLLDEEEDKVNFIARHENIANKFLVKELSNAQREVLKKAIEQWRDHELENENIAQNYINTPSDEQ
ncbi:hypothetical protein FACS1894201_03000 [Bacteroidia bacterium]|nr:hypothetical protein FACS1894201_03000 [Bacteroidia bacterium]